MAEKVVRHALFDYVDPDGVRRVALRGAKIQVDGDALARGEEHGAFLSDEEAEVVEASADGVPEALLGEIQLDGEDLEAAVAELDVDQRAALRAALDAAGGAATSPPGAQGSPIFDELSSTGVEGSSSEGSDETVSDDRPARTANKDVWLEFRGLSDLTEEQASSVTLKQLQDDAFMASYQRPTA